MDLNKEVWAIHRPSGYEVSNLGRVKGRNVEFLSPVTTANGYKQVVLRGKIIVVHRLVWIAFNGIIKNGYVINHIDGNKHNNNLCNLEAITYKENTIHAVKNNLMNPQRGEEHHFCKISTKIVLKIYKLLLKGLKIGQVAKITGLTYWHIKSIKSGRIWKNLFNKSDVRFLSKRALNPTHCLTQKEIRKAFSLREKGLSGIKIAKILKVKDHVIYNILEKGKEKYLSKTTLDLREIPTLKSEIWYYFKKYNLYFSNLGRFLGKRKKIKLLNSKENYSYHRENGKYFVVHRLMWEFFNGKIKKGFVINHINGIKSDNRIENLEMVTPSENIHHAIKTGLQSIIKGEACKNSILTAKKVKLIKAKISSGVRNIDIAKELQVSKELISAIKNDRIWKHIKI